MHHRHQPDPDLCAALSDDVSRTSLADVARGLGMPRSSVAAVIAGSARAGTAELAKARREALIRSGAGPQGRDGLGGGKVRA